MCAFGNLYPQHPKFDISVFIPHQFETRDHSVTSSCLQYYERIGETFFCFDDSKTTKL